MQTGSPRMQKQPIVILGGRSLVAPYLIKRIADLGLGADVVSRGNVDLPEGFRSFSLEHGQTVDWKAPENAIVVSLLPLGVLTANLNRFHKCQSIIALGSTSRFSKAASDDLFERAIAENLELAENILKPWCKRRGILYTILRPTLIYDGINDQNISRIARVILRSGFFPLALPGHGLRQPIHADDVAKAIMNAMGNARVYNKCLNIAGGQILPYRKMVEAIFQSLGRKPRILPLPAPMLRSLFRIAAKTGLLKESKFGFNVFHRMNEDLVYDSDEGMRLLDYSPRPFAPRFMGR